MARSEAPEDSRPYVRLSTDLPLNLKLAAIDDPAAGWAYVVSICMAGQSLSDGHFNVALTIRTAGVEKTVGKALAQQGLWHLPGHDCDRCEQPKAGEAVIHDYLRHQRSAAEVEDLTAKRRAAGREGAKKRWDARRAAKTDTAPDQGRVANAMASAMANAEQEQWQNDGNAMAEEKRGEERRNLPTGGSKTRRTAAPPAGQAALVVLDGGNDAAPESEGQRNNRVARTYTDRIPLTNFVAVQQVVKAAFGSGLYTEEQIVAGLALIADEGATVTKNSLRHAMDGTKPYIDSKPQVQRSTGATRAQAALDAGEQAQALYEAQQAARTRPQIGGPA